MLFNSKVITCLNLNQFSISVELFLYYSQVLDNLVYIIINSLDSTNLKGKEDENLQNLVLENLQNLSF